LIDVINRFASFCASWRLFFLQDFDFNFRFARQRDYRFAQPQGKVQVSDPRGTETVSRTATTTEELS
jgi:hypothetical protein